jgi:stress response protein YsnF
MAKPRPHADPAAQRERRPEVPHLLQKRSGTIEGNMRREACVHHTSRTQVSGLPTSRPESDSQQQAESRLPLVSEEAHVEKRETVTGRARIHVRTDERIENVETELDGDDVTVRHVQRDEIVDPGSPLPAMREEDGVTIIPVFEEVAVIEKRLMLKEEIHIIRRRRSETAVTPVTLRQQRAVLEQLPTEGTDAPHDSTATPNGNSGGQK